jgi:electron transport complex protein RnfE
MASNKTLGQEFKKGLWTDIHPFRVLLGLCPALAVTNSFINGLAMGLAALFVMVSANVLVSVFRKYIVSEVRIPAYVVIISSLVTITDLFLAAMFPTISKALGPYIPLIIVNCMILGRVEAFAAKNPVLPTIMDSLGIGVGFTISLCLMGGIREILGFGSILGFQLLGSWFEPWIIMILPAGAFLVLGGLIALVNYINDKKEAKA